MPEREANGSPSGHSNTSTRMNPVRPYPQWIRYGKEFESVLSFILRLVLIAVFSVLFCTVFIQVLGRYLQLPFRTMWTTEIAQFLFVWISVLGACVSLRENRHIRLGLFVDRMPFAVQRIVEIAGNLVVIATSVVMIHGFTILLPRTHRQIAAASRIRMSYVYVAGLLGAVLFIAFSVTRLTRWFWYRGRDEAEADDNR